MPPTKPSEEENSKKLEHEVSPKQGKEQAAKLPTQPLTEMLNPAPSEQLNPTDGTTLKDQSIEKPADKIPVEHPAPAQRPVNNPAIHQHSMKTPSLDQPPVIYSVPSQHSVNQSAINQHPVINTAQNYAPANYLAPQQPSLNCSAPQYAPMNQLVPYQQPMNNPDQQYAQMNHLAPQQHLINFSALQPDHVYTPGTQHVWMTNPAGQEYLGNNAVLQPQLMFDPAPQHVQTFNTAPRLFPIFNRVQPMVSPGFGLHTMSGNECGQIRQSQFNYQPIPTMMQPPIVHMHPQQFSMNSGYASVRPYTRHVQNVGRKYHQKQIQDARRLEIYKSDAENVPPYAASYKKTVFQQSKALTGNRVVLGEVCSAGEETEFIGELGQTKLSCNQRNEYKGDSSGDKQDHHWNVNARKFVPVDNRNDGNEKRKRVKLLCYKVPLCSFMDEIEGSEQSFQSNEMQNDKGQTEAFKMLRRRLIEKAPKFVEGVKLLSFKVPLCSYLGDVEGIDHLAPSNEVLNDSKQTDAFSKLRRRLIEKAPKYSTPPITRYFTFTPGWNTSAVTPVEASSKALVQVEQIANADQNNRGAPVVLTNRDEVVAAAQPSPTLVFPESRKNRPEFEQYTFGFISNIETPTTTPVPEDPQPLGEARSNDTLEMEENNEVEKMMASTELLIAAEPKVALVVPSINKSLEGTKAAPKLDIKLSYAQVATTSMKAIVATDVTIAAPLSPAPKETAFSVKSTNAGKQYNLQSSQRQYQSENPQRQSSKPSVAATPTVSAQRTGPSTHPQKDRDGFQFPRKTAKNPPTVGSLMFRANQYRDSDEKKLAATAGNKETHAEETVKTVEAPVGKSAIETTKTVEPEAQLNTDKKKNESVKSDDVQIAKNAKPASHAQSHPQGNKGGAQKKERKKTGLDFLLGISSVQGSSWKPQGTNKPTEPTEPKVNIKPDESLESPTNAEEPLKNHNQNKKQQKDRNASKPVLKKEFDDEVPEVNITRLSRSEKREELRQRLAAYMVLRRPCKNSAQLPWIINDIIIYCNKLEKKICNIKEINSKVANFLDSRRSYWVGCASMGRNEKSNLIAAYEVLLENQNNEVNEDFYLLIMLHFAFGQYRTYLEMELIEAVFSFKETKKGIVSMIPKMVPLLFVLHQTSPPNALQNYICRSAARRYSKNDLEKLEEDPTEDRLPEDESHGLSLLEARKFYQVRSKSLYKQARESSREEDSNFLRGRANLHELLSHIPSPIMAYDAFLELEREKEEQLEQCNQK